MRAALTLVVGLLFAAPAFAGDQGNPGACTGSTPEMVDCLMAQHAHWDKELTIAYQQAMKDAPPAQKQKLRDAERAWIKYRDANCAYYAGGRGHHRPHQCGGLPARHDPETGAGIVERRRRA